MSVVTYIIDFKKYYVEPATLPDYSGIYCVYACTYDAPLSKVYIRKLLYIGESEDIHDRVSNHEHREKWKSKLRPSEVLCFNAAQMKANRERAEAAMIYSHQPPCNEKYKYSFPFDHTTIQIKGMAKYLKPHFKVSRTTTLRKKVLITE